MPAAKQRKVNTSWFTVARGVAGDFAPAWAFPVFDVRLLRFEGSLFATCVCARCPFGVYLVQLTGEVTADGGIRKLRAWVTQKATTRLAWAQGRNHALFVGRRSAEHSDELMVQPWLGMTASFGTPLIQRQRVVCHRPGKGPRRFRVRGIQSCATVPPQQVVRLDRLRNLIGKDLKRLIRSGEASSWANSTSVVAGFGTLELISNRTLGNTLAVPGGHTISSTTHLVRSRGPGGCDVLVGVGHLLRSVFDTRVTDFSWAGPRGGPRVSLLCHTIVCFGHRHRSAGDCAAFAVCNLKSFRRSTSAFRWGSQYTHFFYAVEASAPFRLLATSNEFCLGATANDTDCRAAGPNVAVARSSHCLAPGLARHAFLGSTSRRERPIRIRSCSQRQRRLRSFVWRQRL